VFSFNKADDDEDKSRSNSRIRSNEPAKATGYSFGGGRVTDGERERQAKMAKY